MHSEVQAEILGPVRAIPSISDPVATRAAGRVSVGLLHGRFCPRPPRDDFSTSRGLFGNAAKEDSPTPGTITAMSEFRPDLTRIEDNPFSFQEPERATNNLERSLVSTAEFFKNEILAESRLYDGWNKYQKAWGNPAVVKWRSRKNWPS